MAFLVGCGSAPTGSFDKQGDPGDAASDAQGAARQDAAEDGRGSVAEASGSVPDAGDTSDSAMDPAESASGPTWQSACFNDAGLEPTQTGTSFCNPNGTTFAACAGCPGTYGYTCWDSLAPSANCAQWSVNKNEFCCQDNLCVRAGPGTDIDCANKSATLTKSYACNPGVMPNAQGCTQLTAGPPVIYCCE